MSNANKKLEEGFNRDECFEQSKKDGSEGRGEGGLREQISVSCDCVLERKLQCSYPKVMYI